MSIWMPQADSLGMDSLMALELRTGHRNRYKIELPVC
jgi:acyl carrier protein